MNNPYIELTNNFSDRLAKPQTVAEAQMFVAMIITLGKPLIVEIGSGSGNFIVARAERFPEKTFLGVELRYKRCYRTLEKAKKRGLQNVFVLRYNGQCLADVIPELSVTGIHFNFPEPWEKRRQRGNRIFNRQFVETIWSFLRDNGELNVKTDHREYFDEMLRLLDSNRKFEIVEQTVDLYQSEYRDDNTPTEFEQMYVNEGSAVCYLKARKRTDL